MSNRKFITADSKPFLSQLTINKEPQAYMGQYQILLKAFINKQNDERLSYHMTQYGLPILQAHF